MSTGKCPECGSDSQSAGHGQTIIRLQRGNIVVEIDGVPAVRHCGNCGEPVIEMDVAKVVEAVASKQIEYAGNGVQPIVIRLPFPRTTRIGLDWAGTSAELEAPGIESLMVAGA